MKTQAADIRRNQTDGKKSKSQKHLRILSEKKDIYVIKNKAADKVKNPPLLFFIIFVQRVYSSRLRKRI